MSYTFQSKTINIEALQQSTHWFDRTGKEYEIKNMHRNHAIGAMKKLFVAFGQYGMQSPLYKSLEQRAQGR